MNSASSLNLTLSAIGGAGLAGVKIAFAPGAAPSGQVGRARLSLLPADHSGRNRRNPSPAAWSGLEGSVDRLSCQGSIMEDLYGVSALLSLPAASALPEAKLVSALDGSWGKKPWTSCTGPPYGSSPLRHPPARTQLSLDGQRTPYELRIAAHGRILNAREGRLTG